MLQKVTLDTKLIKTLIPEKAPNRSQALLAKHQSLTVFLYKRLRPKTQALAKSQTSRYVANRKRLRFFTDKKANMALIFVPPAYTKVFSLFRSESFRHRHIDYKKRI